MRIHTIQAHQEFALPVDRVFAYLSEHENLTTIFGPVRIQRVRDGEDGRRNGVGSCRRMSMAGAMPFEETVTEFVPNERIVYQITKGSPLRDHEGVMEFKALPGGGSALDYSIRLGSPIPGLTAIVRRVLARSIAQGLKKVDAQA